MKAWTQYAVAGFVLAGLGALLVTELVSPGNRQAVWFGAGLGYVLQIAAFGALRAVHGNMQLFMLGWAAGIGLRFLAVGVTAFWLMRTNVLPPQAALLSLVGFLVILLFLEPLFLRRGQTTK